MSPRYMSFLEAMAQTRLNIQTHGVNYVVGYDEQEKRGATFRGYFLTRESTYNDPSLNPPIGRVIALFLVDTDLNVTTLTDGRDAEEIECQLRHARDQYEFHQKVYLAAKAQASEG